MNFRFLDAARDDLRDAVAYYEDKQRGLGAELRAEVRATIERIELLPEAWPMLGKKARRCRTRRFPYGVVYQTQRDEILIVAVSHLHREPEHWNDRL